MRYLLKIRYDGSELKGFATQPCKNTVEDVLNKVLSDMLKEEIKIVGCSRTDARVHAYGQMVHFDCKMELLPVNIKKGLNAKLRRDISCSEVSIVGLDFHARFNVKSKTYKYVVMQEYDPLFRTSATFFRFDLDVDAMIIASKSLIGCHDFSSFCSKNTGVSSKVRTVNFLNICVNDGLLVFEINGDGFLYNMVRIIVGTLLQVGRKKISPEDVKGILESKDRKNAGFTAAPQGLYLMEVFY